MHDFLRFHFVAEHPHEQGIDQAASSPVKGRQRLLVAPGDGGEQPCVFTHFRALLRRFPTWGFYAH